MRSKRYGLLVAQFETLHPELGNCSGKAYMHVQDVVEFRSYAELYLGAEGHQITSFIEIENGILDEQFLSSQKEFLRHGKFVFHLEKNRSLDELQAQRENPQTERISWKNLWQETTQIWAIVDAVAWPDALPILQSSEDNARCLYASPNPELQATAPWLTRFDQGSRLEKAWRNLSLETHAGIIFSSASNLNSLRKHFRRYTMAWLPNRYDAVYFRFYDPRVLMDMRFALSKAHFSGFAAPVENFYVRPSEDFNMHNLDATKLPEDSLLVIDDSGEVSLSGNLRISQSESDKFDQAQQARFTKRIARSMNEAIGQQYGFERCLNATQKAMEIGATFKMTSKQQVSILARSVLLLGDSFTTDDPDARLILNDNDSLAFEKATNLRELLGKRMIQQQIVPPPVNKGI